jgi:hypothetical protein
MLLKQLLTEEAIISQLTELDNCFVKIFEFAPSIPKFPGEQLKQDIENSIITASKLLNDFAKKMLPFAKSRGYKTDTLQKIIDNPEKAAKFLISKYASAYKDDGMSFKINDILKNIDLDLKT